jgi:primosomal protein N' (replication factor Y)
LTQVAGRGGRGEKSGQVIIQTYHPLEYAIQLASQQDFAGYFEHEISTRRELGYPPFCHLILLLISGVNLAGVQKLSAELKQVLEEFNKEKTFTLLGPAPAPIEKIRRKYRYRILLKTNQVFEALRILEEVFKQKKFQSKKELKITVDVDPLDLL